MMFAQWRRLTIGTLENLLTQTGQIMALSPSLLPEKNYSFALCDWDEDLHWRLSLHFYLHLKAPRVFRSVLNLYILTTVSVVPQCNFQDLSRIWVWNAVVFSKNRKGANRSTSERQIFAEMANVCLNHGRGFKFVTSSVRSAIARTLSPSVVPSRSN